MTRIYLVDDHAMMRDGLAAVLQAAGLDIEEFRAPAAGGACP